MKCIFCLELRGIKVITKKKYLYLCLLFVLTSVACTASPKVEIGESIDNVRKSFLCSGGKEIDLSRVQLDYDNWLFAYSDEEAIVLIHTDYQDSILCVGQYAQFSKQKKLQAWDGSKPISEQSILDFESRKDGILFYDFVGYFGENYDEDTYVYFLQECGFVLYNSMENSVNVIYL